ncbi:zonular occludens toxin domain-containing protein [Pseudoduganella dura]|uniref:zonular occludens toxin domain-containing protein n=1 Tax=Pseudoduganella dura TaxID=321982 RepID=UPI001678464B|nr:zonular occludens toxin domain-containing protein [Pseudoduganella dura]GGY21291.1 membrane protein [Pseudoduganella dura]
MPINAFGGGVGTGKTYGVVEHVILPAIAKGRFVITNIEGLNEEAIYEYVAKEFYKDKIICIGHIRSCGRNAPEDIDFFPGVDALDKAVPVPAPDAPKVIGGDLVVVDEATRYWSQGEKVSKEHAYFFREHRHFANEMGHTCDLVVIDPDLSMLARALKGKIEMSSITHKPKELGLNRYVVQMFRAVKLTGKPVSVGGPYKFKPEIYALYRSYAAEGAKEQSIDARQSLVPQLLRNLGGLVFLLVVCIVAFYMLYQHKAEQLKSLDISNAENPAPGAVSGSSVGVSTGNAAAVAPGAAPGFVPRRSGVSDTLRVAGHIVIKGERWVVLSDGQYLRLENPGAFVGSGSMVVGEIQGQRITTWSGPRANEKSSLIEGGK